MTAGTHSSASIVIFTSLPSIFLPRYSGVRPIISPAANTATMANSRMPNRPEPGPPTMTSSSIMLAISTRPESGMKLSCIESTAPSEEAVGHGGEQRGLPDAEADLLAFHVAAGLPRARGLIDPERR